MWIAVGIGCLVPVPRVFAEGDRSDSCRAVCEGPGSVFSPRLKTQIHQIFQPGKVCRVEGVPSETETIATQERNLAQGARMAGFVLMGGCRMNRPVLADRLAEVTRGSHGFVNAALESAGIRDSRDCRKALPAGSRIREGDILKLGHQSMIVTSVGEDPFGIEGRLKAGLPPHFERLSTTKKISGGAEELCREWLLDTSRYQISLIFLAKEGEQGYRVRMGSFESLIGEDHPSSQWNTGLQEWGLQSCRERVLEKTGLRVKTSRTFYPSLVVERVQTQNPLCREDVSRVLRAEEYACARCCAGIDGGKK